MQDGIEQSGLLRFFGDKVSKFCSIIIMSYSK